MKNKQHEQTNFDIQNLAALTQPRNYKAISTAARIEATWERLKTALDGLPDDESSDALNALADDYEAGLRLVMSGILEGRNLVKIGSDLWVTWPDWSLFITGDNETFSFAGREQAQAAVRYMYEKRAFSKSKSVPVEKLFGALKTKRSKISLKLSTLFDDRRDDEASGPVWSFYKRFVRCENKKAWIELKLT